MTSRKRFEVWLASRTTLTDDLSVWQAAERDMLERAIDLLETDDEFFKAAHKLKELLE